MVKAGIKNVCVHKGLFAPGVEKQFPNLRGFADVADVGQAAKDWPTSISSSITRPIATWRRSRGRACGVQPHGRIAWTSDLADIPQQYGVSNVYGDVGQLFAMTLVSEPNVCAALMGTLIKGLGADHICWGTDALWTGSPQWQIEGLRRLEIPEDMQKKYGYAPLGPADGPVKSRHFRRQQCQALQHRAQACDAGTRQRSVRGDESGIRKERARAIQYAPRLRGAERHDRSHAVCLGRPLIGEGECLAPAIRADVALDHLARLGRLEQRARGAHVDAFGLILILRLFPRHLV